MGTTEEPPYGIIFATFMLSCMSGSAIFSLVVPEVISPERLLQCIFVLAGACLILPSVLAIAWPGGGAYRLGVIFVPFNMFELCIGLYFPAMGTLKSVAVPEAARSAIYSLFRMPLNGIVLASLIIKISELVAFNVCALMLFLAFVLQSISLSAEPSES